MLKFILLLLCSTFLFAQSKHPTIKQLFNVRTVKIQKIQASQSQINYGYIVAKDSAVIDITTWFSGYVKTLYTNTLYAKVKKGDPLASIYSPEVYKAKQDYLNAINFHSDRPSPAMVQSAQTKLILLGVNTKEITEIRNSKKVNHLTTIYAPLSGWIMQKNIREGSFVSNKKSLFQITNLSTVWLESKLFVEQLHTLDTFSQFSVTVKGIEKIYQAKKELLYPMLNPKEATITLRLSLDNQEENLKPGMYAKLFAQSIKEQKLIIPHTAVMRKDGKWYAFLATEFKGEYEPILIDIKPLDKHSYEVIKGLKEGESVVNNALFMMDSDAQINAIY